MSGSPLIQGGRHARPLGGTEGGHGIVVGGGIVGLATARALVLRGVSVTVLEAESGPCKHQTGNNSGVIHSGLYYKPGSLKATNCVAGRDALYAYCEERKIPHERCGKLVVATTEAQVPALDELERRGRANGLQGIRRLGAGEIREREPHVAGVAGLEVPETGIVAYIDVARQFAKDVGRAGSRVVYDARVRGVRRLADGLVVTTSSESGEAREYEASFLVNCAGLQCDRVARLCGVRPEIRIIPFRGEYYDVVEAKRHLVRHLVYPVPDPRFPFLGVHFTRSIPCGLEAGPNAVLALCREGYSWRDVSARDMWDVASYGGFWRLAARYWRTGIMEVVRSLSKRRFVAALRELVPEIRMEDVVAAGAGVRAQAVSRDGRTLDDFCFMDGERSLHVLNAPSPAATASISIGETIAERVVA